MLEPTNQRNQLEFFLRILEESLVYYNIKATAILNSTRSIERLFSELRTLKNETSESLASKLTLNEYNFSLLPLSNASSNVQSVMRITSLIKNNYANDAEILKTVQRIQRLKEEGLQRIVDKVGREFGKELEQTN